MGDAHEFPEIEPGTFDVIVIGTGLQESIVAAAAASSGQSVLHIDSNSFYGHHWASLSLDEVTQWASSGGRFSASQPQTQTNDATATLRSPDGEDLRLEFLTDRIIYSDFEQKKYSLEGLGPPKSFNLDIAGPKLCLCGGPLVDLLLKSGGSKYLEFKSVEGSYIWSGLGQGLTPVPDSRASIFQDRTLSLVEKKHLMRFFKLIQNQEKLSQEDLESSFVHFLDQQRLPSSIKSMILYAIALADYDQEDESQGRSTVLRTKDGIERLVLYLSSIGRFVNASGAFLYPVYGQAELPQAFCRTAAIKGTIYVAETRFASHIIVLKRFVQVKDALQSMVINNNWGVWKQKNTERANKIKDRLLADSWWEHVEYLLKITEPIMSMLRYTDMDRPCLGEIYDGIDSMIEKIRQVINEEEQDPQETFFKQVQQIINERWNKMTIPLHLLAYSLTLKYYSSQYCDLPGRLPPYRDMEVFDGYQAAFRRIFPADDVRDVIMDEFIAFVNATCLSNDALRHRFKKDAHGWWYLHGQKFRTLQPLAIKVISQVLRMAVTGLLIGKESRIYKGIKIASGQYLFSQKLVINFSTALPSGLSSSLAELKLNKTEAGDIQSTPLSDPSVEHRKSNSGRMEQVLHPIIRSPSKISWKVARCICIIDQSLKPDLSTVLVAFPPRSIIGNQRTTIRALQLGSNTSACPEGKFVVYFSTPCSDPVQGKEALMSAMKSLFMLPNETPESEASSLNINELERSKPTLLWFTFFVQHLTEDLEHLQCSVVECCIPDETLCYRQLVMSTSKMFQELFHSEMLFPQTVESEDAMENEDY